MEYSIQELSRLAGVTTRTLCWYDQIVLLKPCLLYTSLTLLTGVGVDAFGMFGAVRPGGFAGQPDGQRKDRPDSP